MNINRNDLTTVTYDRRRGEREMTLTTPYIQNRLILRKIDLRDYAF